MFERIGAEPKAFYENVAAIFMHRPYHWMPVNGMTSMYVWGLADSEAGRQELAALADQARVPFEAVLQEIRESRDLLDGALNARHRQRSLPERRRRGEGRAQLARAQGASCATRCASAPTRCATSATCTRRRCRRGWRLASSTR